MGYENSPAVALVATRCALCARPLLDAESVECGMGPTCRARHGAGDQLRSPNVREAAALAAFLPEALRDRAQDFHLAGDLRGLANWAVSRVAVLHGSLYADEVVDRLVLIVAAAGFVRLAGVLADRHSRQVVRVTAEGSELVVAAPYNERFVEATRHWRGRRWDRDAKVMRLPVASRAALWTSLQQNFGQGTMVVGEHGMKRI